MIRLPRSLWPGLAAGALLAAVVADAQTTTGEAELAPVKSHQPSLFRIPGILEVDLPMTERAGSVQLGFLPRFQDLVDRSYLRLPLGLRWGVNDHFELNSEIDTYVHHGLRKGESGYGFSELQFGAKYAWLRLLKPTWDTSVGINTSFPVSRPPIDLTDGQNHISPYIVFGRRVPGVPGLMGFLHTDVDFIWKSSTPGQFARNEPHSNSITFSPGLVYDRWPFHYTLEIDGTTTSLVGEGHEYFLSIRPGVVWDLPNSLKFHARGRWLVGVTVTATFGPDGNTLTTGGRFRGEISLSSPFRIGRNHSDPPTSSAPSD